jgi:hypothetical protein
MATVFGRVASFALLLISLIATEKAIEWWPQQDDQEKHADLPTPSERLKSAENNEQRWRQPN